MKNYLLGCLFLLGCGTPEEVLVDGPVPEEVVIYEDVEAKVIYIPFVNKAGKLIEGAGDYFLVYNNEQWFIKFSCGEVLREDIAKLLDQTNGFFLKEYEGLWDTDDPNVQSRVGKYVCIQKIL